MPHSYVLAEPHCCAADDIYTSRKQLDWIRVDLFPQCRRNELRNQNAEPEVELIEISGHVRFSVGVEAPEVLPKVVAFERRGGCHLHLNL